MGKAKGIKEAANKLKTRIYDKQNRLQQNSPYLPYWVLVGGLLTSLDKFVREKGWYLSLIHI